MKYLFLCLVATVGACKVVLPEPVISPPSRIDTIREVQVRERTVTDTLLVPGEEITIRDSAICPPGLVLDSVVYITRTVHTPPRTVHVFNTVYDTLETVEIRQVSALDALVSGNVPFSWLGLLFVIAGLAAAWLGIENAKLKSKK